MRTGPMETETMKERDEAERLGGFSGVDMSSLSLPV